MTPQEFVHKWAKNSLSERSGYQQHFLDICHMIGHPTPAEIDATGESFTFEKGGKKTSGTKGFADVWKRGFFGWEYKGKHANLEKAYDQLLLYRESLENPPLLIVSDTEKIQIHTSFTNTVKSVHVLEYEDLLTPAGIEKLRAVFNDPDYFKTEQTTVEVTTDAAKKFALLSDALRRDGADPHDAAHFLIRLLFSLFAEDVGLLPNETLKKLIAATRGNPEHFIQQLGVLFGTMSTGGYFGLERIPHINGGLFDDAAVLPLDRKALDIIDEVSRMDWGSIEPSIFGTLFERSLDPAKRSQLGAHFTSTEDILLVIEPVLLKPLRRGWEEVRAEAEVLKGRWQSETTKQKKSNRFDELHRLLTKFIVEIAKVRVLDPACGSGNFLYVALRELLDLQKEVILYASDVGFTIATPSVNPDQLHGIEKNEYASELATTSLAIGYIQWLRDNGFGFPNEPILKRVGTIENKDAILDFDDEGKPFEPEWPEVDVIVGNPPFLGGNKMRKELGDHYVDALFSHYRERVPPFSDLVCYWFDRAREAAVAGRINRVGLLATNSIRGGVNKRVVEAIKEDLNLFWAISDQPWVLDGAAVRVSMIGFGVEGDEPELDGRKVAAINADLTSGIDLSRAQVLDENLGICFMGPSPKAPFDIDKEIALKLVAERGNPHGRPNSDVVRPVFSAVDLVRRSRDMYTIDFAMMGIEEASQYHAPFEYVRTNVLPIRSSRRDDFGGRWWAYARPRPELRAAIEGLERVLVTPAVAKHRVFVWIDPHAICNQQTLVFARSDDYFFGVLHSRLHELWSLRMGTRMGAGNDPRYTPTTTFETFPFPWPPGEEPIDDPRIQATAEAGRELVEKRDRWLNPEDATEQELKKRTLTNLYNERPMWLDLAHKKLDEAVFEAYGWPKDLEDEEVLGRLLGLNKMRV